MEHPHDLEALLGYHLRRASNVLMSDLSERLSNLGLRPTDATILVVLDVQPGLTQSEIGRTLAIKRANMAPLIAGLISRGMIVRVEAKGRPQPLALSQEGKALASAARGQMKENDADFFNGLPDEHQRLLLKTLSDVWRSRPKDRD